MATTAAGTPYVESSDLVANYPGVSLALANHIDTSTGKILQVVRDTDTTLRSTTSATFVDVPGMSVTITPQSATSNILLMLVASTYLYYDTDGTRYAYAQITDSSNVAISGAQSAQLGLRNIQGVTSTRFIYAPINVVGYHSPGSTSAITYKARFAAAAAVTLVFDNAITTGQLFAIEVAT